MSNNKILKKIKRHQIKSTNSYYAKKQIFTCLFVRQFSFFDSLPPEGYTHGSVRPINV